ncbi:ion channel protein [Corynebacteriales bacterium D3-21]|uniref:Ion channel protein n=1 Tax=Speluncibacter jeojiensis TaxID=2710754 RepID=A0A9X4RFA2_9ACTN|nr:ion channel protein [Corynebacteriales bacterium D3-21]
MTASPEVSVTTTLSPPRSTRTVAKQAIPALLVGVGSALVLIAVSVVANKIEHFLWNWLPDECGLAEDNRWWIFGTLTVTGILVGLIVWKMSGHAGPDPATTGLVATPLKPRILPSLALTLIIGLAGGVSLGPENPIVAINVALAVWVLSKAWPKLPPMFGLMLAAAGTIGAMFGTPVAAALLFTEMKEMHSDGQLWDKLFGPLVAAGSGSLTMYLLASPVLSVNVPAYGTPHWMDLVSATVIGIAAMLLGFVALYAFEPLHWLFHKLPNPFVAITLGGVVLGVLGAIGGKITLFKGLDEMKELASTASQHTTQGLVLITVVKLVALVVAGACGFRGGRIFPAVFIGVGAGLVATSLFPSIPVGLAIASGVLALVLVVSRDGWLALFMGATVVGDVSVLPVLCLVILPLWLLVAARPEMIVKPKPKPDPQPTEETAPA